MRTTPKRGERVAYRPDGTCVRVSVPPSPCDECDGTGKVVVLGVRRAIGDRPAHQAPCDVCAGSGEKR